METEVPKGWSCSASWLVRWVSSALVLIGGIIVLSLLHPPFAGMTWVPLTAGRIIFRAPLPTSFLFCGITVTTLTTALFLGWTTISTEASSTIARSPSPSGTWAIWLIICAICISALKGLLDRNVGTDPAPLAHFLVIAILTFVAIESWCFAMMPRQFWSNCLRRDPKILPAAVLVGTLSYVCGHHTALLVLANFNEWIVPLQQATLGLVAILLRLVARDIVFDPQDYVVGTQHFAIAVGVPCAGWEGIGLFCTFFSIYLWFYRRDLRFPGVLVLLPAGSLIIWLCNAVRITLLILLGNLSASIAIEGFHSVAGWLFFDAVTLMLTVLSRQMKLFSKAPLEDDSWKFASAANPAAPYLAPLIVIIATSMVTRVFFNGFDYLYPLRLVFGGAAVWFYHNRLSLSWKPSWMTGFLGLLSFAIWLAVPIGDSNFSTNQAFSVGLNSLPRLWQFLWTLCRVLTAVVIVPIAEELAFRGYLLRKLVRTNFETVPVGYFTWFSFIMCSVLFGALHARWLAGCLVGMIFAIEVYRRGLLSDAILCHGVANGLLAAYVLTTHQWSLWN